MKVNKQICKEEILEITGATLLSVEEAKEFLTKKERKYSRWWWLRSPGYIQIYAADVNRDGGVGELGHGVDDAGDAVRPALKILNLEKSNFAIGDIFKINGYDFKIISQNLAWLYRQDIGLEFFDSKSNDYEKSHIKKYVDDWFEKEIKGS